MVACCLSFIRRADRIGETDNSESKAIVLLGVV
jgi:hypothetical protein